MLSEQQILANADEWYAYEMSLGMKVPAMTQAQKDRLKSRVLAEVRIVFSTDEECMDAALAALRSGVVEPIVRLTDAEMAEIEDARWGE